MQKPADTQYAIHDLLKNRWSPRAYSSQPIESEKIFALFEAARWSPSGGNVQPWAFVVVTPDDASTHQGLVAALTGRNPLWAGQAPALVVAIAQLNPEKPAAHRYAYYDLGQAVAHLSIQAEAMGLAAHQMGGFQPEQVRELLHIPEGYEPMTIIAVGYLGKVDDLHPELRERETAPRTRKPLQDFVFGNRWDQPLLPAHTEHKIHA